MTESGERWRPVPGYEGVYSVSDRGRVRRELTRSNTRAGRLLKLNRSGPYPRVSLWKDGEQETAYVHRLVAAAFIGPCPEGAEVNHRDGDPGNPAVENLEYVGHDENLQHAHDHGLVSPATGGDHPRAKLSDRDVELIRASDASPAELASKHGVSERHVRHIQAGERRA